MMMTTRIEDFGPLRDYSFVSVSCSGVYTVICVK
jgi:hypothetical protein